MSRGERTERHYPRTRPGCVDGQIERGSGVPICGCVNGSAETLAGSTNLPPMFQPATVDFSPEDSDRQADGRRQAPFPSDRDKTDQAPTLALSPLPSPCVTTSPPGR